MVIQRQSSATSLPSTTRLFLLQCLTPFISGFYGIWDILWYLSGCNVYSERVKYFTLFSRILSNYFRLLKEDLLLIKIQFYNHIFSLCQFFKWNQWNVKDLCNSKLFIFKGTFAKSIFGSTFDEWMVRLSFSLLAVVKQGMKLSKNIMLISERTQSLEDHSSFCLNRQNHDNTLVDLVIRLPFLFPM